MVFLLVNLFLLAAIAILLLLLSAVWPPDSPWAPWWQMPQNVIDEMCKLAKISKKDVVYDLGCGTGWALITANKEFGATGCGVEIDPLRFLIAKWNVWRKKSSVVIKRKNFFDENISSATVIFVYLIPKTLKNLMPKFIKELKPGTKFITYVYDMPKELYGNRLKLLKYDKDNKFYIYQLLAAKSKKKPA